MESLLPFIIMLIIGSLFGRGKKKPEEQQEKTKPFAPQKQEQENPIKKLKEMSKDLYKEIQQEFEVEQEKANPKQQSTVTPKEVVAKIEARRREVPVPTERPLDRRQSREAVRSRVATKKKEQINTKEKQLMPTSSDDIMKGIIFSEIIGPPKSKR